jgi:multidrug efflux pump subunit AcrB
VLSTLVAEIYGPGDERRRELALQIRHIFEQTEGVVDVDWYVDEPQPRYFVEADREKAALHGISVTRISSAIETALSGTEAGLLHLPFEKEDVAIVVRPPLAARAGIERLAAVKISAPGGELVPLSALVTVHETGIDRSIYHKNLMPVVYVIGDVAGEKESPVYAILEMRKKIEAISLPEGYKIEQHTAGVPRPTAGSL